MCASLLHRVVAYLLIARACPAVDSTSPEESDFRDPKVFWHDESGR